MSRPTYTISGMDVRIAVDTAFGSGDTVYCTVSDWFPDGAREIAEKLNAHASQASRIAELEKALNNVIEAAERSLGDHSAPHDCFATGPMTGNPIADLVACPGCVQVNEIAAARSVLSTQAAE